MAFGNTVVWALALTVCGISVVCGSSPPPYKTDDIIEFCSNSGDTSLDLWTGALIYSMPGSQYYPDTCVLTIHATRDGSRLFVKSERMNLSGGDATLELYDNQIVYGDAAGEYSGNDPIQLSTTQEYLTIKLITRSDSKNVTFRLVVTPFSKDSTCGDLLFTCDNGDCIGIDKRGDGHQNCPDNSDESDPPSLPCPNGMLNCSESGPCIASSWKCDRFVDCPNSWDEQNCEYKCPGDSNFGVSYRLQCRDGNGCYDSYGRCDDWHECEDGSDDMNCDDCDSFYQYMNGFDGYCAMTRSCLSQQQICDGVVDCPNGADEDDRQCNPGIYWYWSAGQLAGLFVGLALFVIIVIVIVAVVHKQCRKEID